jgi:hypothetical protein
MCKNRNAAEQDCLIVYGHTNVAEPDFMPDGHYYAAAEDLIWVVHPSEDAGDDDHDGPGVTGIRNGARPICQLAQEKRANQPGMARMVPTPPAQPMSEEGLGAYPKFVNDFNTRNLFKKDPE